MSLQADEPYYPIGNTLPVDVTLGCHVNKQCDILLLGCGDIRNILFTVHSLQETGTQSAWGRQFHFHVNDNEVGILSRDLVLLHVLSSIDPSQSEDMTFLWCVWYDILLSSEHRCRLMGIINNLSKHKSGIEGVFFGNESTETAVKNCLESWMKDKRGSLEVIESRRQVLSGSENEIPHTQRVTSRHLFQYHIFKDERNKDRYQQEVQEYTEVGTTRINTSRMSQRQVLEDFLPNVTFLPPGAKNWRVPIHSSPFLCFQLENEIERYDGSKHTVARTSLEKLTEWVTSFKQFVKQCTIKVTLWLEDARRLCEETLPVDLTFDFIDTSNLADSLGLVSLLVACRDRLKGDSGVLRTEVFDWYHCLVDGVKYLRLCMDIPPLMYPTVLGLHLAEELLIGHERFPERGDFEGCDKMVLRWRKAGAFTPCDLNEDDSVSSAIEVLKSLTNPQRITDFPRVKSSHCDERSQAKALARLREVTTEHVTGRDNKVVEYNDRYEIELPIERDDARILSVTTDESDERLVRFQLSNDKYNVSKFKSELRFSCPVVINKKNTWTEKGFIKGTLMKDKDKSVGERVLPWRRLTSKMVSNLPDYPSSEYNKTCIDIRTNWVYPCEDYTIAVEHDKPYVRQQLRDICRVIMQDPKITKEKFLSIPRKQPLDSLGSLALDKYKSTIILDGLKMFEEKPTMFLTVYDHDSTELKALLINQNLSLLNVMQVSKEKLQILELNVKLLEGWVMLKSILMVNSRRIQQDGESCPWKMKSFLRMRYPFEACATFEMQTKCIARFTEDGTWKYPGAQLEFYTMMREMSDIDSTSKPEETLSFREAVAELAKQACDSCGRTTDCKKCAACNKVYYCSRSCQRRAWPQHKVSCSK